MSFRPKPWYFKRDCPVCTQSASSFCRNPLYFFAYAMWVKWWYHDKFQPHSMCKKVKRVTTKTGCTSCTKRTISFKVSGFHTETRLLQRDFIFLTYWNSIVFCVSYAPFKATSSIFNTFWDHLLFFSHLPICLES